MKQIITLLALTLCLTSFSQQLNVVGGYFPYWRSTQNINFSNYNYLYFAFAFPTDEGGLAFSNKTAETAFSDFNEKTVGIKSKRLISIGSTGMATMADDPVARLKFADTLRKFCRIHNYDGIDMDWEAINNTVDRDNFTALMKDIRNEIDSTNLEFVITIGFGNYWLKWYEDEALNQADFLQIMIYDQTGTWSGSSYGAHASMDHFKAAESYWLGRGYSRDKLVMGLPYYGYKFKDTSGGLATAVTYAEIMKQFPNAKSSDNLLIDGTGHYFFNGVDLIKEKINYAKNKGFKGVFVWELAQDDPLHSLSLDKSLNSIVTDAVGFVVEDKINTYPNPVQNELNIEISAENIDEIILLSSLGKILFKAKGISKVSFESYPSGVYMLKIKTTKGKSIIKRIIK